MTLRKVPKKADSGSPSNGEPDYLVVGIVRRPHGLQGEMLMEVLTDFPERLHRGVEVSVGTRHRKLVIDSCRSHTRGALIRFRGIDSPEAASPFRNQPVYVPAEDRPALPDGHYYHHELLGCSVQDERAHALGILHEIMQTGANDVYVIQSESGRELLLPAIEGVIIGIDVPRRLIRVRVPAGIEAGSENRESGRVASRLRREGTSDRHGRR